MDVTEPLYQVPDPKKLSVHHFCVYPQNSTVGTRKEYWTNKNCWHFEIHCTNIVQQRNRLTEKEKNHTVIHIHMPGVLATTDLAESYISLYSTVRT
jgi:hypothetical protein